MNKPLSKLKQQAQALGGVSINGKRWVFDYVLEVLVPESYMPEGSERHKRSEEMRTHKFGEV